MQQQIEPTVGQLVARDYRTAQVFRTYKLDFCCGGDVTLKKACENHGVDYEEVQQALHSLGDTPGSEQHNYNEWSPDFLVDYILNNHHSYVRNKLPEIAQYAGKVARVHGARHPELKQIRSLFSGLQEEITDHLEKEETLLFPYIKELVRADREGDLPRNDESSGPGYAEEPIALMEEEHDEAGAAMKRIRELSNDFTPPDDACTTYRVLFQNLEAFELDLHKHVHLENNILFPKTVQMENRVQNR